VSKSRKKHFLITAGGTREYIDPVRFISNASSGKMGYALAAAAQAAGHNVTLISASEMQPPVGIEFVGVVSATEMFAAVKKFFADCDCLIMAAAVADYTPARPCKTKIKKSNKLLTLKLKQTKDILAWAAKQKRKDQYVVGFALEDKDLRASAEKKLASKRLDMIIANTPDSIAADKVTIQIKTPDSRWLKLPPASKNKIARRVIRLIDKTIC
jgi:phosphopantothenoylcysteine decarboxylase/phosphopantothenate--cysteine ligase